VTGAYRKRHCLCTVETAERVDRETDEGSWSELKKALYPYRAALGVCSWPSGADFESIKNRVALSAHLHVNKDAASEMYRLPIQSGGYLVFT
jgi:hypothetical protein